MERIGAGLFVALTIAGCQPTDARPDAGQVNRAAAYGGAAGSVRPGQVTAQIEQLLWAQQPPEYIRNELWHLVRGSYDRRQYQPYWVGAGAPERAAALVGAVCRAEEEGLRSADYNVEKLISELAGLRRSRSADRLAEFDLLLTGALFAYGEDLLLGRVSPGTVAPEWDAGAAPAAAERLLQETLAGTASLDSVLEALRPRSAAYDALIAELRPLRLADASGGWAEIPDDQTLRRGVRGPAVDALRRRLAATGELAAADTTPNRGFDRQLSAAVARFQARHGLEPDGIAGQETIAAMNVSAELRIAQIEANLERYRWIPEDLIAQYALFDVPESKLTVFGGDSPVTMTARLSDSARRTLPPVLADTITGVVPDSSLKVTGRESVAAPVLLALAHHAGLRLGGLSGESAMQQLRAGLPIFVLDPTARRKGDEIRFAAAVASRDVAIAQGLGPARPQPPERCEDLALSAASAVLSAP